MSSTCFKALLATFLDSLITGVSLVETSLRRISISLANDRASLVKLAVLGKSFSIAKRIPAAPPFTALLPTVFMVLATSFSGPAGSLSSSSSYPLKSLPKSKSAKSLSSLSREDKNASSSNSLSEPVAGSFSLLMIIHPS